MANTIDNSEIKTLIPHRYPFLLVDKVVDYEVGQWIRAIKNVTANEYFFQGHFPTHAVMPGVLITEAMAQAAGILIQKTTGELQSGKLEDLYFLAGVNNARFKSMVLPGDQLEIYCEITRNRLNLWRFDCTASVDGKVVSTAEIMNIKAPQE